MEPEGYPEARFGWVSHHGYRYTIEMEDEGCFIISYEEEGKAPERVMSFNEMDADGLTEMMKCAVAFYREKVKL